MLSSGWLLELVWPEPSPSAVLGGRKPTRQGTPLGASCSTSLCHLTPGLHVWPGGTICHKLVAQRRVFQNADHFIILVTSSGPEREM